jgi:hypothetical protein
MNGLLSNLLVLLAPYGTERASTAQFVSQLQAQGAQILKTQAKAEVSLTRNVLAASACDVLRQAPDVQWLFWLDQDVSGEVGNVVAMIRLAELISNSARGIGFPTLSGVYVNRYTVPPRLACHAIRNCEPVDVASDEFEHPIRLTPALCGMGCLLQHRSTFLAHCDEAPHFVFMTRDNLIPEVCSSHRIHASELAKYLHVDAAQDLYYWQSEDFDYCAREFEVGRLVMTCPFTFGHECNKVLWPDSETVFPGLRPC